jgi:hypothetical protein
VHQVLSATDKALACCEQIFCQRTVAAAVPVPVTLQEHYAMGEALV